MLQSAVTRVLRTLASLRLTVPALLLLIGAVLASYRVPDAPTWWMLVPLVWLVVNLLAALFVHPRLRRLPGLLVFHLALLVFLTLLGLSELTMLYARVEIVEGQALGDAHLHIDRQGAAYSRESLAALDIVQGGFSVQYVGGLVRGATRSRLLVRDADGSVRTVEVGDARALELAGYRLYTTSNKGYAALLSWRDARGRELSGAVHMPSYPQFDWKQVNSWVTPAGEALALELPMPLSNATRKRPWVLRSKGSAGLQTLRVTHNGRQTTLRRGEVVRLADGSLRFDGAAAWMGYRLVYQPLLNWLLATGLVGVLGLAVHFLGSSLCSRSVAGSTLHGRTSIHVTGGA